MKTVLWTQYGPPDVLKLGEADTPVPGNNAILIRVEATTVTLGDCEMRALRLPLAFKVPIRLVLGVRKPRKGYTLGQEFAGVVEAVGNGVTRFAPGDKVFGQTGVTMSAYAQYLVLKANDVIAKKPDNISFETAAAMPLGGLEAKYFIDRSGLRAGSKALVIGSGGSIGTMAIQILKRLGAEVTAVDTEAKFAVMRDVGADHLIDYTKTDYLRDHAAYDGVFDVVGKIPLKRGLALLRSGGVYLHANPRIRQMLFRRLYSGRKKRLIVKSGEPSPADLQALAEAMERGELKPLIDKVMPLSDIVQAHQYVEDGKKKGNLVIRNF